jgi:rhamnogalacturonyl hydrolase YesR
MRPFIFILLLFLTYNFSFSQKIDVNQQQKWVDSLYNTMTFEEKVGQLFMVAAYSNKKEDHVQDLDKLIAKHKIGGLCRQYGI